MGAIKAPDPVKLFCGLIAGSEAGFQDAERELERHFGALDARSEDFPFTATDYYREEMGEGLRRRFVTFAGLSDPGRLPAAKLASNAIEAALAAPSPAGPRRRVNLDPGYVTPSQVVLATTKNFAHRLYLGEGIYAEITLNFRKGGGIVCHAWTYPDFRSGAYTPFFLQVRQDLMAALRRTGDAPR